MCSTLLVDLCITFFTFENFAFRFSACALRSHHVSRVFRARCWPFPEPQQTLFPLDRPLISWITGHDLFGYVALVCPFGRGWHLNSKSPKMPMYDFESYYHCMTSCIKHHQAISGSSGYWGFFIAQTCRCPRWSKRAVESFSETFLEFSMFLARRCCRRCLQLAEGVVYLHSQNPIVVHRDLKATCAVHAAYAKRVMKNARHWRLKRWSRWSCHLCSVPFCLGTNCVNSLEHCSAQSLNVVLDLSLNIKLCDFGLTESMVPGSVCPAEMCRTFAASTGLNNFEYDSGMTGSRSMSLWQYHFLILFCNSICATSIAPAPQERTHITKKNNGGSPRYMAPEVAFWRTSSAILQHFSVHDFIEGLGHCSAAFGSQTAEIRYMFACKIQHRIYISFWSLSTERLSQSTQSMRIPNAECIMGQAC